MAVVHGAAGPDGRDVRGGQDGRAGVARGPFQLAGDRAHAADRHVPVPRPAADQVVEEADVLLQVLIVSPGEGPDQRIRQDHAADQVAAQFPADRLSDGMFDHGLPRRVGPGPGGEGPRVGPRQQRRGHGGPESLRELPAGGVERGEGAELAVGSADGGERRGRGGLVPVVHQQGPAAVRGVRGVGGIAPPRQRDAQAEVVDDLPGQEADEVRVAREAGVDAVERVRGYRGAAGVFQLFQDEDVAPGLGQVRGRGQAVVAAADDDGVKRLMLMGLLDMGLSCHPDPPAGARRPATGRAGRRSIRRWSARERKRPRSEDRGQTRRRGDLNPRWSCAPHFISSEAHSAALARLQLLLTSQPRIRRRCHAVQNGRSRTTRGHFRSMTGRRMGRK